MKYLKTENCAPCNEKEKPVKLKCWKVYCCNFMMAEGYINHQELNEQNIMSRN